MKDKKLMKALGLVDDKYIDEADPARTHKRKRRVGFRVIGAIAACFAVALVGLNIWLFMPYDTTPPSVKEHESNEYYEIIKRMNALTYRAPEHTNNFDKFFDKLFGNTKDDAPLNSAPEIGWDDNDNIYTEGDMGDAMHPTSKPSGGTYEEVTDNQVEGVIESDIFKRSSTHIFHLRGKQLTAYSIAGEASEKVGKYTVEDDLYGVRGMFLSEDCTTLTVICTSFDKEEVKYYTELVSVDVSDPTNMKSAGRIGVSGSYIDSRLVDGELLLLTRFIVHDPDFDDVNSFVPQIVTDKGSVPMPATSIIYPDTLTTCNYTVVCKIDQKSLDVNAQGAFLSYTDKVYVSAENIFVTRQYSKNIEKTEDDGWMYSKLMTEISCMKYEDLSYVSTTLVEGYVKDQYSLDQKDGVLRVVTTTSQNGWRYGLDTDEDTSVSMPSNSGTSASLYCADIATGKIIASVERFAPVGETVRSVRFDGDYAYVCTAVQITDPVFFFDLSDLKNITYKDTGNITGFSTSLINMGNGYLLGIGVGSFNSVKIEVYVETEDGVASVCVKEYQDAYYATEYKSYYIDRENGLIGMGITVWNFSGLSSNHQNDRYIVLRFDGSALHEVVNAYVTGDNSYKRGVYIDGYMYMLGDNGLTVEKID